MDISLPTAEGARVKILTNASDLLVEAELLYSTKHFPRAYALAHFALEEASKLAPLIAAAADKALGLPVDLKNVHHKLTSHEKKLAMASTLLRTLNVEGKKLTIHEALMVPATSAKHVNRANELKNRSLYCGFRGSVFEAPSDAISETVAADAIAETSKLLEMIRRAETHSAGRMAEFLKNPDIRSQLMYARYIGKLRSNKRDKKRGKHGHIDAHGTLPRTPPPFFLSLRACQYFEEAIEILAPKLTTQQIAALRISLIAVVEKDDFVNVLAFLGMVARENGLELPPVE